MRRYLAEAEHYGLFTCLRDFLEWYNNQDLGPFVQAVRKLQAFYCERNIDIFKVAMSVP